MSTIFEDNSTSIGNTPLVKLNRVIKTENGTNVYAKIEARNPSFSIKCRIGASMVWDAENKGLLKEGKEIVEPTIGNTGIALAFVAAARGYGITLTMPSTMSLERRKLLTALGANVVLTDGAKGMGGAMDLVAGADNIIVTMTHASKDGQSKLLSECTLPLTGKGCIKRVLTDLALMDIEDGKFVLRERAPGVSVDEIKALTAGELVIPGDVPEMTFNRP